MFRILVSVLALVPIAGTATGAPAPVQGSSGAGLLQKQLVVVISKGDGLTPLSGHALLAILKKEKSSPMRRGRFSSRA